MAKGVTDTDTLFRKDVQTLHPLENCTRCGEEPILVELSSREWFARVRRSSRCKRRKTDGCCKTEICETAAGAATAWNSQQAGDELDAILAAIPKDEYEKRRARLLELRARIEQSLAAIEQEKQGD